MRFEARIIALLAFCWMFIIKTIAFLGVLLVAGMILTAMGEGHYIHVLYTTTIAYFITFVPLSVIVYFVFILLTPSLRKRYLDASTKSELYEVNIEVIRLIFFSKYLS